MNPAHSLCRDLSFAVIDIGSGADDGLGLKNIMPFCAIHAVEPRADSFSLPERFYQGARRISYNVGLAGESGSKTLYVTRIPEASSLLKPCERNVKRWRTDNGFDVVEERNVECLTLAEFCGAHGITGCDLMKIDTQGTELSILLSGKEIVRNTGVILMEVEFVALYENQPLFGDVVGELAKLGFRLVNLIHGHSAGGQGYEPQKRIWSDCLFIREDQTIEQAIRSAIILCEFGYTIEARWFMEDRQVPEEKIVEIMRAYKSVALLQSGFVVRTAFRLAMLAKNSEILKPFRRRILSIVNRFSVGRFIVQLIGRP